MLLHVIITNWNGAGDTKECIGSVKSLSLDKQTELEIVVVDNASTDDSVQILKKIKSITLLENSQNLGFTGGYNRGIDYSLAKGAEYIWLLNPDMRVKKDSLQEQLRYVDERTILTPKIFFYPGFEFHKERYSPKEVGHVLWSAGGTINWQTVLGQNRGIDLVDNGQFDSVAEVEFATGASVLAHRQVFEKLKGFDLNYYLYLEDADFSLRAKRAGFHVKYIPTSIIWHKNSRSSSSGSDLHDYYLSRNRLLFGFTHGTVRLKLALVKESIRLLATGRPWQKNGIKDFFSGKLGQGSFTPTKNA